MTVIIQSTLHSSHFSAHDTYGEAHIQKELDAIQQQLSKIIEGRHNDPFGFLGVHRVNEVWQARVFVTSCHFLEAFDLAGNSVGCLEKIYDVGIFEGVLKIDHQQPIRYRARADHGSWDFIDPYTFGPVLGPLDDYYIAEGSHLRLFDKLGAHVMQHESVEGVHFAVWAPNAIRVSVVGSFNAWDGRCHSMRLRFGTGIWEIFIPDVRAGEAYKYEIIGKNNAVLPLKSDPFAFQCELRPNTASIVAKPFDFQWDDQAHVEHWSKVDVRRQPISIYEVHAGSWMKQEDGSFYSFDELAQTLIPYVLDMGFTHIEFMPISEHPYDPSWGYQTTGLFAPSARFGEPEQFARFVNGAHKVGLGVIVDWVPAHFPTDLHGLAYFDGTALYEHEDPRKGFHPDWNTAIYNFGRKEVFAYLLNSAVYFAEKFHVDGLRVDAVASMLYLDYSRKDGEWIANEHGGRENLEAVNFLQKVNEAVYAARPSCMMIAEESTSWPGVSQPVYAGGLGFGFKWNMGFMNDTLRYLSREPVHRQFHHSEITFGLLYAFTENFILPISHDEVVHGKGSMLTKMAGDDWQKFATLRAYYGFMWSYPGKKLLFMGQEFAQRDEWRETNSLNWSELEHAPHKGMQSLVRDLNHLYRDNPALHARDCEADGFSWLIVDDFQSSIFVFMRCAPDKKPVVIITNFTPVLREGYRLPLPIKGNWREVINTDSETYGGCGKGNLGVIVANGEACGGQITSAMITIPPLATLIIECV
jgi:1,4-alpha-glucan branching enzyme